MGSREEAVHLLSALWLVGLHQSGLGVALGKNWLVQWLLGWLEDAGLGVGVWASASPSNMGRPEHCLEGCWEGPGEAASSVTLLPMHIPLEPSTGLGPEPGALSYSTGLSAATPRCPFPSPPSLFHCLLGAGSARTQRAALCF